MPWLARAYNFALDKGSAAGVSILAETPHLARMPIDVEKRRWYAADVIAAAGISLVFYRILKERHALFAGRQGRALSVVDTAVVASIGMLDAAGIGRRDGVAWAQAFLPKHIRAVASNRLNFGVWSGVTVPITQAPPSAAVSITLDLDTIVEQAIVGLKLPLPVFDAPPPLADALTIVERADKFVGSASFERRCAAFVANVASRKPAVTTMREISVALGVPLWILEMRDASHGAFPIGERVRDEVRRVLQ